MSIAAEHRRAVRSETIVSTLINSLMPAGIAKFAELAPPDTILGSNGIISPMCKAAGLATRLMALTLTLIARVRVWNGTLPALDRPSAASGLLRLVNRASGTVVGITTTRFVVLPTLTDPVCA